MKKGTQSRASKRKKNRWIPCPNMFFELFRINISYFEREDLSEYRKHKVFRLGPESKHILLRVKVAKYIS